MAVLVEDNMHTGIHVHTGTHAHTHAHKGTHAHRHTHTHTRTHIKEHSHLDEISTGVHLRRHVLHDSGGEEVQQRSALGGMGRKPAHPAVSVLFATSPHHVVHECVGSCAESNQRHLLGVTGGVG